jgi:Tfp pilus assembly protein PilV
MKRLLLLVLVAAVLSGVGVLSVRHYQNYTNLKRHSDQVAAAQAAKEVATDRQAEQVRQAAVLDSYNKLYGECQKGVAAYDQLPPATKAKLPAPVCGLELIQ